MPRSKNRKPAPAVEPAPEYTETAVRRYVTQGLDPASAVYRAWVDYVKACRGWSLRTELPDPSRELEEGPQNPMAAMYARVTADVPATLRRP